MNKIKFLFRKFRSKSISEKITYIVFFIFFLTMALIFVFPIVSTFFNAFTNMEDYYDPLREPFALPKTWQFKSWGEVFTTFKCVDWSYWDMLWNSLWMLVVRVFVNVLSSTLIAYAVARFRFPGKHFLYGVVIFSQTIPIIGSGASAYKLFTQLNMINNPFTIWFAWAIGFDFAFIVLYGTFRGISSSYSEAAKIDGANNFVVLFRIIMPQAFPSIAALAITQAIGVWNDYSTSMIYMRHFPTIAYGLYIFPNEAQYYNNFIGIYSAAIIVSMLPALILYAASQKLVLKNMTAGGLKG